jgi:phosphoglycolate phosphatase-like HAD superfamily hydrolase
MTAPFSPDATFLDLVPLPAARPSLRAVLFDFDGTISTLREGWPAIMAPMMAEMIAGPTDPTDALRDEVAAYIDHSTGIQTIHQMVWLAETVARYGLNPDVHDAWWYKAEYLRRLQAPVQARAAQVTAGVTPRENFMMAGSVAFLEALRAAGLAMYVASGTDHPDVVREVGVLGLRDYFVEIAGAPPEAMDCSKEAVLRRLVTEAGLQGPEVAVVGDGRVEIALAREVGALTLGIASDEVARQGINPAKVAKLADAGAHAIVGDFRETARILTWLTGV